MVDTTNSSFVDEPTMKRIQRRGRRRDGRKDGRMESARRGGGVRVTHERRALSSTRTESRRFDYLDDVGTAFVSGCFLYVYTV